MAVRCQVPSAIALTTAENGGRKSSTEVGQLAVLEIPSNLSSRRNGDCGQKASGRKGTNAKQGAVAQGDEPHYQIGPLIGFARPAINHLTAAYAGAEQVRCQSVHGPVGTYDSLENLFRIEELSRWGGLFPRTAVSLEWRRSGAGLTVCCKLIFGDSKKSSVRLRPNSGRAAKCRSGR